MATAVTTELPRTCRTGDPPLGSLELFESPDSIRDPRARHDSLETTVYVLDGVVYVTAEEHEWALTPGDTATIAAGTTYRRWNAGDDEARWVEVYCAR
jgi:mannose-6-phosphate isomerase-like protein (cupin superfamily)